MQRTFQNSASVPHPQMGLYRNWREKNRFLYGVVDVANGQVVLVTTEGLSGARRLAQSITSQKRTRTKRERLLGRSWLPMSGRAAPTIAQDRQPPQTGRRRPRTINRGQVAMKAHSVEHRVGHRQHRGNAEPRQHRQIRAPTCRRGQGLPLRHSIWSGRVRCTSQGLARIIR